MSNSNHGPVFLPLGVSRKQNDACPGFKGFKKPPKLTRPVPTSTRREAAAKQLADLKPGCSNMLLAGRMANEFLTKGTLFGQKFDPARAEAAPLAGGKAREEMKKAAVVESSSSAANAKPNHESYAEVANLMKSDGVHIPGIVNPTQLAQWVSDV